MGGDLKGQWGVGDPAPVGSDKQSQQFQAAFQKPISDINSQLQYTTVNAEEDKNTPLVTRRDALLTAYQNALHQIDPKDEKKAKGAIDKVLADVKALDAEVTKFRKDAETAFTDWQKREPKFDEAVHQVEELEAWEEPKAPPLRGLVDGIRKLVDAKKYAQASATYDQLAPKLKPIYDNYVLQKAAKEKYDPALQALQPRLDEASKCQYAKLEAMQTDMAKSQEQMETLAKSKDFAKALTALNDVTPKVDAFEQALKKLEEKKKAYEDVESKLEPRFINGPQPHAKLEPMFEDINAIRKQMEDAAKQEEFEQATKFAEDLSVKLDTVDTALEELENKKKGYENILEPLKERLEKACEAKGGELTMTQKQIVGLKKRMEEAAEKEDYDEALKSCVQLPPELDAYDKESGNSRVSATIGGDLTLLEKPIGKCHLGKYIELEAKLGGSLKYGASKAKGEEGGEKGPTNKDVEADLTKYFGDLVDGILEKGKVEVGAGPKFNRQEKSVSLAASVSLTSEIGPIKLEVMPIEVSLASWSKEKGPKGPKAAAGLTGSWPFFKRTVMGIEIEVAPAISLTGEATPDYVAIAEWIAEKYGPEVLEAGGPIAGGILGGIALCAATMAAIGYLEDEGKDASAFCTSGAARLREYAQSYGSTIHGKPGKNIQGNRDAEAYLQWIVKTMPGADKAEAIKMCNEFSQENGQEYYEKAAYAALLPTMRQEVKKAFVKKYSDDPIINNCLNAILGADSRY